MAQDKQLIEKSVILNKLREYEKEFGFYEGMESRYTKLIKRIDSLNDHLAKLQRQQAEETANPKPASDLTRRNLEDSIRNTTKERSEAEEEKDELIILKCKSEYEEYQVLLLKLERISQQVSTSNTNAKRPVQTPFGKVDVTIDILDLLRKIPVDWQHTFSKKHNLKIEHWKDKAELSSNEKDFEIRATKYGVEADCKNANSHQKLAQAMVELYLKALEGQKNNVNHKVKSEDPKLQSEIVEILTKAMIERGILTGTINDMPMSSCHNRISILHRWYILENLKMKKGEV